MNRFPCGRMQRRTFLADCGMGFTGLALGSMLARDGIWAGAARAGEEESWSAPSGAPHFAPRPRA